MKSNPRSTYQSANTSNVDLSSANELELAYHHRSLLFQNLVRRFIVQLYFGCSDQFCKAPVCYGFRKNSENEKFSRPPLHAARMMAYCLATSSNPFHYICPSSLITSYLNFADDLDVTPSDSQAFLNEWLQWPSCSPEIGKNGQSIAKVNIIFRKIFMNLTDNRVVKSFWLPRRVFGFSAPTRHELLKPLRAYINLSPDISKEDLPFCYSLLFTTCFKIFEAASSSHMSLSYPIHSQSSMHMSTIAESQGKFSVNEIIKEKAFTIIQSSRLTYQSMIDLRSILINLPTSTCAERYWRNTSSEVPAFYWFTRLSLAEDPNSDEVKRQINNFIFVKLSRPSNLLESFSIDPSAQEYNHINECDLFQCFQGWIAVKGPAIYDYLWHSAVTLQNPPPYIFHGKSTIKSTHSIHNSRFSDQVNHSLQNMESDNYWSNEDAYRLVLIIIHALSGRFDPTMWRKYEQQIHELRTNGFFLPNITKNNDNNELHRVLDELDYKPAIRLFETLIRSLAARRCHDEIALHTLRENPSREITYSDQNNSPHILSKSHIMTLLIKYLANAPATTTHPKVNLETWNDRRLFLLQTIISTLHTVFLSSWNGKLRVNRWSIPGGAVEILEDLYENRRILGIPESRFVMVHLHKRLDFIDSLQRFMKQKRKSVNHLNLLEKPFLFPTSVSYQLFRILNYMKLYDAYTRSGCEIFFYRKMMDFASGGLLPECLQNFRHSIIEEKIQIAVSKFLVVDCRRSCMAEDALDRLWGRERRELSRPLKVNLGYQEGEEGLDIGGVSKEFFNAVFSEAFDVRYGYFITYPGSHLSYFRPDYFGNLAHYELLGLLVGLALRNGCTIPVQFPLAFYIRILNVVPVSAPFQIEDCWPELARGLQSLLDWKGNVEKDISREYIYSYDGLQGPVHINMINGKIIEDSAQVDNDSTIMVTNENRAKFVRDYIHWLTYESVKTQFSAFQKGLFAGVDSKFLSVFTPESLSLLVSGNPQISVDKLYLATTYEDGYKIDTPLIQWFWEIVYTFEQDQLRTLLEFVTSSSRVPMGGIESIKFSVVRAGSDTDRIPSSMTCFGKLLLPEYVSKEKLEMKLKLALENSFGFGSL